MIKHVIFENYSTYDDEFLAEAKELFLEEGFKEEDITQDMLMSRCTDNNSVWFDDEKSMLESVSEGEVIAIADIGRWNGRFTGYKELKSLEDIMYTSCDYEEVYIDGYKNLRKRETHHDGTNSILYRYWKHNLTQEQKDFFLDKIYNGKATAKDITRYTRKAGLVIAEEYGW